MKLSCLQENLSRGLALVGRAVAARSALPVTQNVLLSTEQSMLKLSATTGNRHHHLDRASIEEEGSLAVPARLLGEFVSSCPASVSTLTSRGSGLLQVTCGRNDSHINGTDASEFPPFPPLTTALPPGFIPRPSATPFPGHLCCRHRGVPGHSHRRRVKLEEDRFTLAAADGFRLAVQHGALAEAVESPVEVIVPPAPSTSFPDSRRRRTTRSK